MCTTYPDRPRGAGPGETDAAPGAVEGHGRATHTTSHLCGGHRRTATPPPKVACNSIGRRFNHVRKRCNSNAADSRFEMVTRELHAKLIGYSAIQGHKTGARWTWPSNAHHEPPVWRAPAGPQGLAGLRTDAPSEARGADGERAGRRTQPGQFLARDCRR